MQQSGHSGSGATAAEQDAYVTDKFLGAGGEGSVYIVHHRDSPNEQLVMKKRVCGDLISANEALKEGLAMAKVNSEYCVKLHDIFLVSHPEDATCYILCLIMELCSGGDLLDLLEKKRVAPDDALRIARELLRGLGDVHERKLIHRDVKSENIFLGRDDTAKLGDFGLTVLSKKRTDAAGSFLYSAPEMLADGGTGGQCGEYSSSADVWALGVCLYELVRGEPLAVTNLCPGKEPENVLAMINQLRKEEGPAWDSFRDLLRSMLQPDPFKRPSCSELLASLETSGSADIVVEKESTETKQKLTVADLDSVLSLVQSAFQTSTLYNQPGESLSCVKVLSTPLAELALKSGASIGISRKKGTIFGKRLTGVVLCIPPSDCGILEKGGLFQTVKGMLSHLSFKDKRNKNAKLWAKQQLKFYKQWVADISSCFSSAPNPWWIVFACKEAQTLVQDVVDWAQDNNEAVATATDDESQYRLFIAAGFKQVSVFEKIRLLIREPEIVPAESVVDTASTTLSSEEDNSSAVPQSDHRSLTDLSLNQRQSSVSHGQQQPPTITGVAQPDPRLQRGYQQMSAQMIQQQQPSPQLMQQHSPQTIHHNAQPQSPRNSPQMMQQYSPQTIHQHTQRSPRNSPQMIHQQHSPQTIHQYTQPQSPRNSPQMMQQYSPVQSPRMYGYQHPQPIGMYMPPQFPQYSPQSSPVMQPHRQHMVVPPQTQFLQPQFIAAQPQFNPHFPGMGQPTHPPQQQQQQQQQGFSVTIRNGNVQSSGGASPARSTKYRLHVSASLKLSRSAVKGMFPVCVFYMMPPSGIAFVRVAETEMAVDQMNPKWDTLEFSSREKDPKVQFMVLLRAQRGGNQEKRIGEADSTLVTLQLDNVVPLHTKKGRKSVTIGQLDVRLERV